MRRWWIAFAAACLAAIVTGCTLGPRVVVVPDARDPSGLRLRRRTAWLAGAIVQGGTMTRHRRLGPAGPLVLVRSCWRAGSCGARSCGRPLPT